MRLLSNNLYNTAVNRFRPLTLNMFIYEVHNLLMNANIPVIDDNPNYNHNYILNRYNDNIIP